MNDKLIEFMQNMLESLENDTKWADTSEDSRAAYHAYEKVSECLEFALKNE